MQLITLARPEPWLGTHFNVLKIGYDGSDYEAHFDDGEVITCEPYEDLEYAECARIYAIARAFSARPAKPAESVTEHYIDEGLF